MLQSAYVTGKQLRSLLLGSVDSNAYKTIGRFQSALRSGMTGN